MATLFKNTVFKMTEFTMANLFKMQSSKNAEFRIA
jgi:hypothetical protein